MRQQEELVRATQLRSIRTDLLYVNAKDLIQSVRINKIRAASLSLVPFRHLSALRRGQLISHINIYHLFAGLQYIISFSLQFVGVLELRL